MRRGRGRRVEPLFAGTVRFSPPKRHLDKRACCHCRACTVAIRSGTPQRGVSAAPDRAHRGGDRSVKKVNGMKLLNKAACGTEVIPAASADAGRFELAIRSDARLTRTASARVENLNGNGRAAARNGRDPLLPEPGGRGR